MLRARAVLRLSALATILLVASEARAVQTLVTVEDGVVIYSGPGRRFRALARVDSNVELRAADKVVRAEDGEYYKVVAPISAKRKAIGYARVDWGIRKKRAGATVDDLANYSELALARHTLSTTFATYSDDRILGTVGFVNYMSPGLYWKAWAGAFIDTAGSAQIAALEIGNDAILFGRLSALMSIAAGAAFITKPGRIYAGSKSVNGAFMGTVGLRWNTLEWSAGLGWSQFAIFNPDNSAVSSGPALILEASL